MSGEGQSTGPCDFTDCAAEGPTWPLSGRRLCKKHWREVMEIPLSTEVKDIESRRPRPWLDKRR